MAEQGSGRPQDSSHKHDAPSDKSSTGAKAPTPTNLYYLSVEEARNLVDRLAGPGSRNRPPGTNDSVMQHGNCVSFSGSGHAAHAAIDMVAQTIADDENASLGFVVFKPKPEPRRFLGDKGLTVVSGGSGVTIPKEGKYAELTLRSEILAREMEDAAVEQFESKKPEVKCGGCESKTHKLVDCLMAAPNGLMKGCPMCNTTKHDVDACYKLRDIKTRFRYLVVKRGNMPAFASKQMSFHWASVYHQFRADEKFGSGRPRNVPRLPWTPKFTREQGDAKLREYQRRLDQEGFPAARLPADPATMDWGAAKRTYPLRASKSQSQQVQDVRAQVQDVVNNNPTARVPGAAADAAVRQGPSEEVDIDDILDDLTEGDSAAVKPDSAKAGSQDVHMTDAAAEQGDQDVQMA
ncbi:hypothetical protein CDV36_000372 [Fusarium kuroshium]|uniref:Uncharacterized protein n=1 Tax=Fusarium kuroshium TaxID=2010991 RepID=A0A3M2SQU5_9HYPO|nr:hypothetical protein CDV36_000372 [Fusarium kuroshium]